MSRNRKPPYPSEFKESAIKLVLESEQPISATAEDLGIHVSTLHTWISMYKEKGQANAKGYSNQHHFDEIKSLKKKLARVTQERDLLKKAAAYLFQA